MSSAAKILEQRRRIRSDLVEWCRYAGYEPAKHHRLILQHLTDVAAGKIARLAVTLSPGAGKSTYIALFAAWWLANNPTADGSIVIASHTQSLADKLSIRVRSLVIEHSSMLGIQLDDRTTAANRWALRSGGEVRAVGVGTAVTGTRCQMCLVDDPVKGIEQAMSANEKQKLYDWYRADLSTRLVPAGRVVAVQTRWALDDLLGRLLDEEADRWKLLSLPAYAEENDPLGREIGEPLWSDDPVYNYSAFIAEQKRSLPPRMFVSLFQQKPIASEGNLIKGEWLRIYRTPPDPNTCHFYIGFDLATSEGKGDFSAIVTIAVDPLGDVYVIDVWRKQTTIDKTIDALLDRCRDYRPLLVATEAGGLYNAAGPFLKSRMIERNIPAYIQTFPSKASKELRAQSFIGRVAVKGLYLPHDAEWVSEFVAELISFPSAAHDDMVDSCSVLFQALSNITPGRALAPKEEPKRLVIGGPGTTISMDDLWTANERRHKRSGSRIA
jgi:predicted phage terminase large subunit-like protein